MIFCSLLLCNIWCEVLTVPLKLVETQAGSLKSTVFWWKSGNRVDSQWTQCFMHLHPITHTLTPRGEFSTLNSLTWCVFGRWVETWENACKRRDNTKLLTDNDQSKYWAQHLQYPAALRHHLAHFRYILLRYTLWWIVNMSYVGLEASAWSVWSFSPPSTSMVQYTMRFGARDFSPCTSMITTYTRESYEIWYNT